MITAMLCAALVSACATKYQDMGFAGGVAAEQITADTYRIISRGNAYTSSTAIKDYVLLKAAETTKAAGGNYFIVMSAEDATRESVIASGGSSTTSFSGRTAVTTYRPPSYDTVIKPGQDAYIRVLRVPAGQSPPGSVAADEIIKFVGARVQRD